MRVIGGRFRSRRLASVPGRSVRPTPDRLREALFNVLAPRIENTVFLDAYAGSGAVGIEAISRGARQVILIEKSQIALEIIRKNLNSLDATPSAIVVRGDAATVVKTYRPDIAFVDPPYELTDAYRDVLNSLGETNCPLVIAQHQSSLALEDKYGPLHKTRVLRQGDNSLTFFDRKTTM